MDAESERSRNLGCWNGPENLKGSIETWTRGMYDTSKKDEDFVPGEEYSNFLITLGFGENCSTTTREYWNKQINSNYRGPDGRERIRMSAINLSDRDGLYNRLGDVKCPVLWMHGTSDAVYSVKNAREEVDLFVNAKEKELRVVEDGQHFLSGSHPEEVKRGVLEFVRRWKGENGADL